MEMVQGDEAKLFGNLTLNAIQKWLRANNLYSITFYGKDEGGGGSFQKTGRDEPIFFRNKEELFRKYNEQENRPRRLDPVFGARAMEQFKQCFNTPTFQDWIIP